MTTKEQLAELLGRQEDYLSGNDIAQALGLTRSAVWKAIHQLEEEGYQVEAVKNRGYRLGPRNDAVPPGLLQKYLGDRAKLFSLEVCSSISSTNTVLKSRAAGSPTWSVIAAGHQTAGRGRLGRSFLSPADTGIYLSVLLRPSLAASEAYRITAAAAVAACRAIEACTPAKPSIKWVNDIYCEGRKVCGILTEGALNMETGGFDWAVMGIGFNVYAPAGGFPEELAGIAGAIAPERERDLRCRIAAAFLREFYDICTDPSELAEEYRRRSFLPGCDVLVLKAGESTPAHVLDIDAQCRLLVRYEDGSQEALSTGEVSIRPLLK